MSLIRHVGRIIHDHFRPVYLLVIASLLLLPINSNSEDKFAEYKLKAAYIYNFSKFVEWPDAIKDQQKMTICIDASMETYKILLKELHLKRVHNRSIDLLKVANNEEIKSCSILFSGINSQIGAYKQEGLLTIGESPGFLKQGGMIRFFEEEGKLRFEINPEQAKSYQVNISSKLLRLAKIVYSKTTDEETRQ